MKILIVATSAGDDKLGCWAEELMAPYLAFKEKGAEVTIASIKGGKIPLDPASLNAPFKTPDVEKFMLDASLMALVNDSVAFDTVDESSYDALFLPGGHGIVFDGPGNSKLADTIGKMFTAGKVVSAVCHGPAGLVDAKNAEGTSIFAGKKVTGFSNAEEAAVDKTSFVPFLLEDKMKELGGSYSKAEADWSPHVVRDGNLVTGQNPGSSVPLAKVVLEAIAA